MCLFERLTPDFHHSDDRGSLFQLVHGGYEQVNILVTHSGVTRGGHYHKHCTEVFFVVSGAVTVLFERGAEQCEETFQAGEMFRIPPMVVHTLRFETETVLTALYDLPVEDGISEKDIHV